VRSAEADWCVRAFAALRRKACVHFRIGVENNNDGRTITKALDHLGCLAGSADAALIDPTFPGAAPGHCDHVSRARTHGDHS
jgi:hypothetical protein